MPDSYSMFLEAHKQAQREEWAKIEAGFSPIICRKCKGDIFRLMLSHQTRYSHVGESAGTDYYKRICVTCGEISVHSAKWEWHRD